MTSALADISKVAKLEGLIDMSPSFREIVEITLPVKDASAEFLVSCLRAAWACGVIDALNNEEVIQECETMGYRLRKHDRKR